MEQYDVENIIELVDEIAFQTNLPALNAAVEAAREQVHGPAGSSEYPHWYG
jgi:methyl-accepting chemotaxis protein